MKIAVIEKQNNNYFNLRAALKRKEFEKGWNVIYYDSGQEFLSDKPKEYDVILVDHSLEDGSEKLILNVMYDDGIDIAVMNGPASSWEAQGLVQDDQVNALIDKTNPKNVVDWLNYVDVKHRLTDRIEKSSDIYSEIVSETNGCVFEIKDKVAILGISRLLSNDRIDMITKSIISSNKKAILYFTEDVKAVTSSYFGLLVSFWEKIVKKENGKMAFWVRNNEEDIIKRANYYCLTELFPCFDDLHEAIRFVNVAEYNEKRKFKNECSKRSYA